jgi:hypothetical protein
MTGNISHVAMGWFALNAVLRFTRIKNSRISIKAAGVFPAKNATVPFCGIMDTTPRKNSRIIS